MTLGDGPHQRGRATPGFGRIDLRSIVQQHLDRVGFARTCSHHERGVSILCQRRIHVGSGLDELFDHGGTSVDRGKLQRCGACSSGGGDIGARADQQVCRFRIVQPYRPMKGCGAITLPRINIGLFL